MEEHTNKLIMLNKLWMKSTRPKYQKDVISDVIFTEKNV